MNLQESGEMYLETILVLSKGKNIVIAKDIADYMGFSKAAISRALSKLKEEGFILISKEGSITFTKTGQSKASKIYDRHTNLSYFLMKLGIDEKTATNDACRIEHVISDKTFNAIKKHNKNKHL